MPEGFIGYDLQSKNVSAIKILDKKLSNIFKKDDIVEIIIEYITEDELKEDYISEKEIIIYAVIFEFMPRGFYTKEYDGKENIFKRQFFYNARGYFIIPELETRNLFEIGDCLKIQMKKTK